MKNYIKTMIYFTFLFAAAQVSFAANELSEFCFAGSLQNTGDCIISIEATQHGKYYSLNGLSQCELIDDKQWFNDPYTGIAFGSGYIKDGRYFEAGLRISSSVNNSDMTSKIVLFEIDLQTMATKFRTAADDNESCPDGNDCILEYDFSVVSCQ